MKNEALAKQESRLVDEIFSIPSHDDVLEIWSENRRVARLTYFLGSQDHKIMLAASDLWRAHRRWKLGSLAALHDAFEICREEDFPFPDWLVEICHSELVNAFEGKPQFFNLSASKVQNERKRLQQQKHFQIVYGLENFEDWPSYRSNPMHPYSRAYFSKELHLVSEDQAAKLSSQRQRQKFAARCLPTGGRASNSFESIEKTFDQPKKEIGKRFGCKHMNGTYSNFCVWDIAFLRASTADLLGLSSYQ